MKIKKSELLNLWYIFQKSKNDALPKKYSYFVAKNKLAIESEVIAFEKGQAPSAEYKEYDEKRSSLAQSLADKMPGTNLPTIKNGEYVITKKKDEFEKQLGELKEKYKDAIDGRDAQIKEINETLKKVVDVDIVKIKYEDMPESIAPSVIETFIVTGIL